MIEFLVLSGIVGLFLGFIWHWMWIFPAVLTAIIIHEKYESVKLEAQLEEIRKNPTPYQPIEPQLGMTSLDLDRQLIWGWPAYIKETITEQGVEHELHYDYKGKLFLMNNKLIKIVRFDNKSKY